MVIATFGPTTGWAGKTINYEDGRFALEGVGPLTAADVLTYDRQGHISWAYAGLREWVQEAATGRGAAAPAARLMTATQPVQGSRGFPVWAIVVIAVVGLVVVLGVIAALQFSAQDEKKREAAVKEGIHSIQIGVQSYAVDNQDAYPDPSMVSQSGMASFVGYWPTNPYTGLPMTQGTGPGDFAYALTPDGSFTLVGYGKGSRGVITVP